MPSLILKKLRRPVGKSPTILAARNRDASLSAAERTMYERARVNLISEISPALKVTSEEAEAYLDDALAKGVLKPEKAEKKVAKRDCAKEAG